MSPVRLIIIGILIYLGYRLLFRSKKKVESKSSKREPSSEKQAVEDVLVEDPVCHTLVPKQQAVRLKHNDEIMYFCSDECCGKFIEEKGENK